MPLLTLDKNLRFFYNIFSPKGSVLDPSKPIVLLLHPVFLDQTFFAPQYTDDELAEKFNLILLDHHYHGGTQATLDDEKYDFDMVTRDVFRFLDALEIEKCHVLGVALGATIAVRMAMLHLERILSLTLCSMGPPEPNAEYLGQHKDMLNTVLDSGDDLDETLAQVVSAGMKALYGQKGWTEERHEAFMATNQIQPKNRQLLTKAYSAVFDETAPPVSNWRRIQIPVLIAHGECDNPYPPSIAQDNHDLLSEATIRELRIIRFGPHYFTATVPALFNPIFLEFMKKAAAN